VKKISDSHLDQLKAQQAVRDAAAFAFGSASIEFELEKHRIFAPGQEDKTLRYGALCVELDGHRERCLLIVARSKKLTDALGSEAMREAGVDPESATYTIDLSTGAVLRLEGQTYVEVAE